MTDKRVCLVVGAGDAIGAAIARKFAAEGFAVCIVRRERHLDEINSAGGEVYPFGSDAREEEQVIQLFESIETNIGPLDTVIFNVGANVWFPIAETTSKVFYKVWQMACFAGFLNGREAAKKMTPRGHGNIFFTGASASMRGKANFAAFASAKHGLRALSQSMARELGPKGIHVAHLVIDGAVDTPWIRENFPDLFKDESLENVLKPVNIAEAYWTLHQQKKNAWTHELDIRPWVEEW